MLTPAEGVSLFERNEQQADNLNDCARCGNYYLAVRYDMYADGRAHVFCDCCGAMAEPELWNRIEPMPDRKYAKEVR